jgi:formylglycine-generating enzyme required for sulfatase activity
MREVKLVLFLSLCVVGCSSKPYVVTSNELGVTVRAKSAYAKRAMELAQHECEGYGRSVILTSTDSQHYIYQCVYKQKNVSSTSGSDIANSRTVAGTAKDSEDSLWYEVQSGNSASDYEAYLEQYPKGRYAVLAKGRIKKLGKQEVVLPIERPGDSGSVFRDCPECPEMVVIPPGTFEMGSVIGGGDEKPVHQVTISTSFALGKTEVTQGQWLAIMSVNASKWSNPSKFSECGDSCPVENITWYEANEFISKLNAKTGKKYRLPSEAEWEYACRAGGQNEACKYSDNASWYASNSESKTHPVATKQPNSFGLFDMTGNVWEWVQDTYYSIYNGAPSDGSAWEGTGDYRALRGGGYWGSGRIGRLSHAPAWGYKGYGFRLARSLP